jgi:putative addiction module component (TIGR02574 family)
MTDATAKLFFDALRLSDFERAELAAQLIDSLEGSVTDGTIETDWDAELETRIAEIQSGSVRAVPWREARRQIMDVRDTPGTD